MGNVTGQDRSGYLLKHDATTKEVRRFFVALNGSCLSLYTEETAPPTKIDLLQFATVSKGGTGEVPRIELIPRDDSEQSKLSFIASPIEADGWIRQFEAALESGRKVDEDLKESESEPTPSTVELKDKVQTKSSTTDEDDERESLRKQLEQMKQDIARINATKLAVRQKTAQLKETARLNAIRRDLSGSAERTTAGMDIAEDNDNDNDNENENQEICVPVSREVRRASASANGKARYRSWEDDKWPDNAQDPEDVNVCWEFNSPSGCKNARCRWTHRYTSTQQSSKRKPKWKDWKNSWKEGNGNSWGERSYSKQRSQRSRDIDRSRKREQYVDENRDLRRSERGEQSRMRARTKETKYNKQKNIGAAVMNSNGGNGNGNDNENEKEDMYLKEQLQRKVIEDNRRLKMGANYSSNVYEDTSKAEVDDSADAEEVVRFASSRSKSNAKELPPRASKSSRRRERERAQRDRGREYPVAVAGPAPTSTMPATMTATSSMPNPNPITRGSSMLFQSTLFPPLSASTHTSYQQVHPAHPASASVSASASASKPYHPIHPMPSMTTAAATNNATASMSTTNVNANVYHTYRTSQSVPNPNPIANSIPNATATNPTPRPYGHSHFPSVANGYKAHTAHERVTSAEPTGYYGSNLGWGPSWSPRRKRKYVLVQKNQTIY